MSINQRLLSLIGDGDGGACVGGSGGGDGDNGCVVTHEGIVIHLLNQMSDVVSGIALEHRGHVVHPELLNLALGGGGEGNALSAEVLSAGGVVVHNDDGLMTRRLGVDCLKDEGSEGQENTEGDDGTHDRKEGNRGEGKREGRERGGVESEKGERE